MLTRGLLQNTYNNGTTTTQSSRECVVRWEMDKKKEQESVVEALFSVVG
jgi:hypothetical protein